MGPQIVETANTRTPISEGRLIVQKKFTLIKDIDDGKSDNFSIALNGIQKRFQPSCHALTVRIQEGDRFT